MAKVKITSQLKIVWASAKQKACEVKSKQIDTQHLLWAIIESGEKSVGFVAIKNLVGKGDILSRLKESVSVGEKECSPEYSPDALEALRLAGEEAKKLGGADAAADTGHLLLGLTKVPGSKALVVLKNFQLTPEKIEVEVLKIFDAQKKKKK